MTPKQRLKIYERIIKDMKSERASITLCSNLAKYVNCLLEDLGDYFPEIEKLRKKHYGTYWWKPNSRCGEANYAPRIKFLEKAIVEVKKLIK